MHAQPHVFRQREQPWREALQQQHRRFRVGSAVREARELAVGVLDPTLHELPYALGMTEVEHTHTSARDLVLVRRSDSPPRRADLLARGALAVEKLVIRENEMSAVTDVEAPFDVDPVSDETVNFGEQRIRIEHDTVADSAPHASVQDSAGNLAQHELRVADVHGVTGVGAAL